MSNVPFWLLVSLCCTSLACSAEEGGSNGGSSSGSAAPGTSGESPGTTSSSGSNGAAAAELDMCTILTPSVAAALLGTTVVQREQSTPATCTYSGDAAVGVKEASFLASASHIAQQSRAGFDLGYGSNPQFTALAEVGEAAYILARKVEVVDEASPSGRAELDEFTVIAFQRGSILSLGALGSTREAVISEAQAMLGRLP